MSSTLINYTNPHFALKKLTLVCEAIDEYRKVKKMPIRFKSGRTIHTFKFNKCDVIFDIRQTGILKKCGLDQKHNSLRSWRNKIFAYKEKVKNLRRIYNEMSDEYMVGILEGGIRWQDHRGQYNDTKKDFRYLVNRAVYYNDKDTEYEFPFKTHKQNEKGEDTIYLPYKKITYNLKNLISQYEKIIESNLINYTTIAFIFINANKIRNHYLYNRYNPLTKIGRKFVNALFDENLSDEEEYTEDYLNGECMDSLRQIGKDKNLKGFSYVCKNELIQMILENKSWLEISNQ